MDQLDFTPLENKPSTASLFVTLHRYSFPWQLGFGVLLLMFFVGTVLAIGSIFALITHSDSWGGLAAMGAFLGLGGLYGLSDLFAVLRRNALIKQFALRNGLSFAQDDVPADYPGVYFDKGLVRITDRIRFSATPFVEIGNFRLLSDNHERSMSGNSYGYIRIKLPKQLPNILLASKVATRELIIPSALDGSQKLGLEGNFNDLFTLYVPKGYEQDALYIFTPDVMAKFIDLFGEYSSEIVGDEIYFYGMRPLDLTKRQTYADVLPLIAEFLRKIDKQTALYTDEHVALDSPTAAASYTQATTAEPARQLKESRFGRAVSGVIFIVILLILIAGIIELIKQSTTDNHAAQASAFHLFASVGVATFIAAIIGFIKILLARQSIKKRRHQHHRDSE